MKLNETWCVVFECFSELVQHAGIVQSIRFSKNLSKLSYISHTNPQNKRLR